MVLLVVVSVIIVVEVIPAVGVPGLVAAVIVIVVAVAVLAAVVVEGTVGVVLVVIVVEIVAVAVLQDLLSKCYCSYYFRMVFDNKATFGKKSPLNETEQQPIRAQQKQEPLAEMNFQHNQTVKV